MSFECTNQDLSVMLDSIDVELSGLCNARCTFCPRDMMTREKSIMSIATMEKLIQDITLIRPDGPRTVFFSGFGEPLLNENIFLFAKMITDAFPNTDLVLVSNGGVLDKKICDQLLTSKIRTFTCSFQSLDKDIYESRMVGVDYDKVMLWLNYLIENRRAGGIRIATTCVVSDQTDDELRQLRFFWKSQDVPFIEGRLHNRGGFLDSGEGAQYLRNHCLLFNSRIFIAANGDLLACCNDIDASTKLGNIISNSLVSVLKNKISVINSRRLFPICLKCSEECSSCSVDKLIKLALHYYNIDSIFWSLEFLFFALSIDPDDRDVLFYLGTLCVQVGKINEAHDFLLKASNIYPEDALIYNSLGALYRKTGKLEEAVKTFSRAVHYSPSFIGALANLGDVLFELGRYDEAESTYHSVLKVDSTMSDVWNSLGNVLWKQNQYLEAEEAFRKSLKIDPLQPDVYLNIGILNRELGQIDTVILVCNCAMSLEQYTPELLSLLADTYLEANRLEDAKTILMQAVEKFPTYSASYNILANIFIFDGCLEKAEYYTQKAIDINNNDHIAYCNLGNIFLELRNYDKAEVYYNISLSILPEYAVAYCNLGNLLLALKRFDEAKNAYQEAINIDPFFVDAYCNISNLHRECNQLVEAEEACRKALLLDPESAEALNNLSVILLEAGRLCEAEIAARGSINIKPDFAEAYCSLGNVLASLEKLDESVEAYQASLQKNPYYAEAFSNLGNVLNELGRNEEAKQSVTRAIELKPSLHACRMKLAMMSLPLVVESSEEAEQVPIKFAASLDILEADIAKYGYAELGDVVGALQPFNLAYRLGNHKQLISRYGDIICKIRKAWFERNKYHFAPLSTILNPTRIRLLVVSGHIRRHSVWDVILHGLLRHIDRSLFEIFVYHTVPIIDDETEKARILVDYFVQGPADWLELLNEHRPDVIFYPEIGMDTETIRLASLRLAPLQIASWGHPLTTGLSTIDLFLSGRLMEAQGSENHYREQLALLPGTGACSVLMPFIAKVPENSKFNFDFDNAAKIRFIVCQQMIKFDPTVDKIFPEIAKRSGACCFWFVRDRKFKWASDVVEMRLRNAFYCLSLDPNEYIKFVDWLPGNEFWGLMEQADIFLDLPSFSGYTTAWQAVHCGLPVVTCEGLYLRQRLASGLLRKLGVLETIASDIEEYIAIASMLAISSEKRNNIGALLRSRIGLIDEDLHVVRAFEALLISEYKNKK